MPIGRRMPFCPTSSKESAGGLRADEGFEREGMRDIVAEGVACVGAGAVGLIELGHDGAGGIGGPDDLLQILDEFAAAGIDEKTGFVD